MGAAYYDPKKARRNERRREDRRTNKTVKRLATTLFPSRTKPSIRFCANNTALFYDPEKEVSCVMLNTPAIAEKFKFSNAEIMTKAQAHGVVMLMADAPQALKQYYHSLIDAPMWTTTGAKEEGKK